MALVRLEEGYVAAGGAAEGGVFYNRGGSVVARQHLKPVWPRSESQLAEVRGVTMAARMFAHTMSPTDRETFEDAGCEIEVPIEVWIWLMSVITAGGLFPTIGPSGGPATPPPSLDAVALDPSTGTFDATFGSPFSGGVGHVRVAASRPVQPGRIPRQTEQRVLGSFAFGESVSLTSAYSALFPGGLASEAPILMSYQGVDAASRVASCVETVLIYPSAGGGCSLTCEVPVGMPFGLFSCELTISIPGIGPEVSLAWEGLSANWLYTVPTLSNNNTFSVTLQDFAFFERTELVEIHVWNPDDESQECTAGVELTVESIGP